MIYLLNSLKTSIVNPNTLDSIYLFIGLGIVSIVIIILAVDKIIKSKKTK